MPLYTRRGDTGMTDLADGSRVSKTSPSILFLAQLDHLNAHFGLLIAEIRGLSFSELKNDCDILLTVQRRLFSISAFIANAPNVKGLPSEADVVVLEQAIDVSGISFSGFILPGGCRTACEAHLVRTECRLIEAMYYALPLKDETACQKRNKMEIARYLNRLSDYLFVLARKINALSLVEEEF